VIPIFTALGDQAFYLVAELFPFQDHIILMLAIVIKSNIKSHGLAMTIAQVEMNNTCYILSLFALIEVNFLSVINATLLMKRKKLLITHNI
jgi:hypothetical protein